ncbi:hypothetical protein [Sphingomonas bacterium]|uniref:hypothetical protein n=1 Tax=Sphingomonas bacterium TaxID=1895847 RepID=UPI0026320236|nr:hypothetical protein [Sphingomonas bacterium]MDB5678454.1 hypothetical protein [Sphingomonas bacterium]
MRSFLIALAVVSLSASPALAAPCKDAKGKFMKCPAPAKKVVHCKFKGKFAKCGTPGAKPV